MFLFQAELKAENILEDSLIAATLSQSRNIRPSGVEVLNSLLVI